MRPPAPFQKGQYKVGACSLEKNDQLILQPNQLPQEDLNIFSFLFIILLCDQKPVLAEQKKTEDIKELLKESIHRFGLPWLIQSEKWANFQFTDSTWDAPGAGSAMEDPCSMETPDTGQN